MFLYELAGPDPLTIRLIAVLGQLKSNIESGKEKSDWTTDELIQYLDDSGIILDKSNLFDLVKTPPLNNIITNIQGDSVIFKGQQEMSNTSNDETKSQEIVNQMAKSAMK
jgi:hypothetical protein